ncbi:unnamed protein product [Closterium sp. Naga37s-1]|nr:unnamed protein product [Closterium sp. Naga37s-1]
MEGATWGGKGLCGGEGECVGGVGVRGGEERGGGGWGVLKGFDQATNIILDESHERVYSTKHGVEQLVLGLYIIRGDNIAVVGELDEDLDSSLDFDALRAQPLQPVCH